MNELLAKIAEALGLEKDADEATVLAEIGKRHSLADIAEALELDGEVTPERVVEKVKELGEDKGDEKSLEDRAKQEGKILVSASDYDELRSDAQSGKKAADKLHERDFEDAYKRTLARVAVDAKPETKERFRRFYDRDPEATIEMLDALAPIANAQASGSGDEPDTPPEGVPQERHDLHQRTLKHMSDNDMTPDRYTEALDVVMAEIEREDAR